jgi:hypothetical protein
MEKMMGAKDESRSGTRKAFIILNDKTKTDINRREDIDVLFVNYNAILSSPKEHLEEIHRFLKNKNLDLEKMVEVVDEQLYRQKRMK